ncbi:hypothetical protein [Xenorhabdus budapestensis]|uniref:DUF7210 domain-containing protein n=1 Tax=Xenorhabdus budapestensis TaxID=290110 RepID=A0A2D0IJQ5_XENBU|nr:hypothetical protein [Xenorhabdus budapestensis]PHM21884.1 hypothetical protein Xbud_03864 [Xenorhabdus budapestensis]
MTKKTQEPGGLPPELQVGPTDDVTPQGIQPTLPGKRRADEKASNLVVVKGNTVRHNSVDYPENTVIDLQDDDARRLIQLGVILRLDDLRAQLLSSNPVTVQDGITIQRGDHAD